MLQNESTIKHSQGRRLRMSTTKLQYQLPQHWKFSIPPDFIDIIIHLPGIDSQKYGQILLTPNTSNCLLQTVILFNRLLLSTQLLWKYPNNDISLSILQCSEHCHTTIDYRMMGRLPFTHDWFGLIGYQKILWQVQWYVASPGPQWPRSVCTKTSCYTTVYDNKMTSWKEAFNICESRRSTLLSINSDEEYHLMLDIIRATRASDNGSGEKKLDVIFLGLHVQKVECYIKHPLLLL